MYTDNYRCSEFILGYATDVGHLRQRNEDNLLLHPKQRVFVVADGMGGHASGDIASRICVETMFRFYADPVVSEHISASWKHRGAEGGVGKFKMDRSIQAANIAIYRTAQKHRKHQSMGTTVTAIQVLPQRIIVGFVGDSRLYRLRSGELEQITQDHSLANEYLRLRMIRPEELKDFQYKNVILRALGLKPRVDVEIFETPLQDFDRYLLCTDGLTDLVPDADIRKILNQHANPEEAAQSLVEKANSAGGHDNSTIMVLDVLDQPTTQ
jgi:protein phosphatase